jgi:broad specificity phosphatase PhoE
MAKKPFILVVRHPETSANTEGVFRGMLDEPLDDKGIEEAENTADFLTEHAIKRIVSSPMLRTCQMAQLYAEKSGLQVEQTRGLLPLHNGVFAGLQKEETKEAFDLFVKNPQVRIPNGESLDNFEDRMFDFYNELFDAAEKELIVIFCHDSSIIALDRFVYHESQNRPGIEEIVGPGGVLGVYQDGNHYELIKLFEP